MMSVSEPSAGTSAETKKLLQDNRQKEYSRGERSKYRGPYMDVMTFQSQVFASKTSIDADDSNDNSAAHSTETLELMAKVRLLLFQPIAIPDLEHTGLSCNLHEASEAEANTGIDNEQVKLFYPTGAKSRNFKGYVRDNIHRHQTNQHRESPSKKRVVLKPLHTSQSAPTLLVPEQFREAPKASPVKMNERKLRDSRRSLSSITPLLDPELAKQTKEVLAAIRSNNSKMNELLKY